jgi:hypothetical protein
MRKEREHRQEESATPLRAIGTLILGPVLGMVYAIFLPFIGLAMLPILVGRKVLPVVAYTLRSVVSFGWRPAEAYLAGKKLKEKETEKAKEE